MEKLGPHLLLAFFPASAAGSGSNQHGCFSGERESPSESA